jgi:hypothetical protein
MRPMVTLKQLQSLKAVMGELRMDQHCSYSTILTKKMEACTANPTSLSTTLHTVIGGGCIMLWVCLSSARTRLVFGGYKQNRVELSIGNILEENLVQSAFQQTSSPFSRTIT